jgi:NADH-quinone oxidoreductase subunit G
MLANINVSEPKPPEDPDSALSFTMEGYKGMPPSSMIPFFWAPGWNSVQSINKFQAEVGGPLQGGDPGKRLFTETPSGQIAFLNSVPSAFKPTAGELVLMPLMHIFGSEELSLYTNGVAERTPKPYVAISKQDAAYLKINEGEMMQIQIGGQNYELPVKIKDELPDGLAGIPFNVPGLSGIAWPAKAILKKV